MIEGRIPLTSTYKVISFLTMIIAATYVFLEHRLKTKSLGTFIFPLIFIFHVISFFGIGVIRQELDIFRTPLFGVHIVSSVFGYSAFVYSMVLGVMYMYMFHSLKKRKLRVMYDRLPPLETLERMNATSQVGGLVFLTLGIAAGGRMAHIEWNRIPLTDPKIYLTGLIFIIYMLNVFFKFALRWSGRRMAFMSVFGFGVLLLVFIGVNFLLPTMHRF
jgi:ABC-type transport system involved in cytochrome c biogenesis permease subunit